MDAACWNEHTTLHPMEAPTIDDLIPDWVAASHARLDVLDGESAERIYLERLVSGRPFVTSSRAAHIYSQLFALWVERCRMCLPEGTERPDIVRAIRVYSRSLAGERHLTRLNT